MFEDDQRYAAITITLLSSNTTRGQRSFEVLLVNPGGGAGVSLGSSITVVIPPTVSSFGIFEFDDQSLSSVISFDDASSFATTTLSVITTATFFLCGVYSGYY